MPNPTIPATGEAMPAASPYDLSRLRREARAAVARWIDLLDTLDIIEGLDADAEDNGDHEPSLASLCGTADAVDLTQLLWSRGSLDDRELDAAEAH